MTTVSDEPTCVYPILRTSLYTFRPSAHSGHRRVTMTATAGDWTPDGERERTEGRACPSASWAQWFKKPSIRYDTLRHTLCLNTVSMCRIGKTANHHKLIRTWFFAAAPVIDASRVRENWFPAAFIMEGRCQSGMRPSTGKFCRFLGGFGGGGVGSSGQGRSLRKNGLGAPPPGRRGTVAGEGSSVPRAFSRRRSICQRSLVIRGGVHVVTPGQAVRLPGAVCARGVGTQQQGGASRLRAPGAGEAPVTGELRETSGGWPHHSVAIGFARAAPTP